MRACRVAWRKARAGPGWRSSGIRLSDLVPALADGGDDGWVAELGSQPAHGLLDRGGERVGRGVPDPLQQFLGGDHPAGAGEQVLEHGELLGAERQPLPGTERGAARVVPTYVTIGKQGG